VSFKGQYFIVKRGPDIRDDRSNVRFTTTRVFSGIDACTQTFGEVTKDMFVKGMGPNKALPFKKLAELMNDPEGWTSMEGIMEIIDADSRAI